MENNNYIISADNSLEKLIKNFAIKRDYFYDTDNVIEKENLYDVICAICNNILNEPISCSLS